SPDPVRVFLNIAPREATDNFQNFMTLLPPLSRLAVHIFSICPNSASCERLFSAYGQILSDKRTSMLPTQMCDLAELKMHIRNQLIQANGRSNLIARAKRRAGTLTTTSIPGDQTAVGTV